MTDLPDANEFGGLAPGVLDRSVIALTSRMPNNWLGLRLAILLRRISTMRLEHRLGRLMSNGGGCTCGCTRSITVGEESAVHLTNV